MSCAGECAGTELSAISYLYPAVCVVIGGVTVARFVLLRRILYADGALPSTGPVVYQQYISAVSQPEKKKKKKRRKKRSRETENSQGL